MSAPRASAGDERMRCCRYRSMDRTLVRSQTRPSLLGLGVLLLGSLVLLLRGLVLLLRGLLLRLLLRRGLVIILRRRGDDLGEVRVLAQELHLPGFDVENGAVHLDLAGLHLRTDGVAELHQLLDARHHVHLDRRRGDLLLGSLAAQVLPRLLHDGAEPHEEPVQQGLLSNGAAALCSEGPRRGTLDGTALRVAEENDELDPEGVDTELQATDEAALGVRQGVAGVAEHEEVPRLHVEKEVHGRTGIRATDDARHRQLAVFRQCLEVLWGPVHLRGAGDKPLIAVDQLLKRLRRGHWIVFRRPHLVLVLHLLRGHALRGGVARDAVAGRAPGHGERIGRCDAQGARRPGVHRGRRQAVLVDAGLEAQSHQTGQLRGKEADHGVRMRLGRLGGAH
mmetsp:Transcript_33130/g.65753  ORF Transcript_33130/g.65753 Transcript_33130/m.65753 type:complete len:394 (-) Transcript_33130:33-1214(-)